MEYYCSKVGITHFTVALMEYYCSKVGITHVTAL